MADAKKFIGERKKKSTTKKRAFTKPKVPGYANGSGEQIIPH
jgi:hypothetical protein